MDSQRRNFFIAAAVGLAAHHAAWAQSAPADRTIKLIVPFPPGGGTDASARLFAQYLSTELNQSIVVDNRPGAGGNIGAQAVAAAAADGLTLLFGQNGIMAINPALYPRLTFDPDKDFIPIAPTQSVSFVLIVAATHPARNVADLITELRRDPAKANYASGGNGTTSHLAGYLFCDALDVQAAHVPYRGGAPAMTDLIGGQVSFMIEAMPSALPQIRGGRVRALAVTTARRHPELPDIVTFQETGMQNMSIAAWGGLFAPAGTPVEVARRLETATRAVNALPAYRDKVAQQGSQIMDSTATEFASFIRSERSRWGDAVRRSGAKVD